MTDAATLAYALDLFSGMGDVSGRRMFGGAGLYAGGVIFGLIIDDRIFLKADGALKEALAREGSGPWVYAGKEMPYSALPEAACDDPEAACAWGRRALAAAEAIRAAKPVRRRREPGRGNP